MDDNNIQSNLTSVKEMILDEEKLVTYVSLSKELCIHVNDSKHLLTEFVKETRKNQNNLVLNVNYIISGLTQDNKARSTVSSEKEMDEIRHALKIVFFEHIYSVSKGSPNKDNVALLAVNTFEDFFHCTGLIKGSTCIKRSSDEIGALKFSSQVSVSEQKLTNVLPIKVENKETTSENTKTVSIPQQNKSEPIVKMEVDPLIKDTPTFSNARAKPDSKKNAVKSQKSIAGFFSKSNSAPSKTISKEMNRSDEPVIKKEKESPKKPKIEKMDIDKEIPEPKKESKFEIKQVNGKNKNENLTQIKKNAKVDKKRKRVLQVLDSESDEEKDPFGNEPQLNEQKDMSDDEIPPTPTVNTVKITSGITNPKKRRKIVDKTYTDEDGYILTKKEEVYESCSDNEEEASVKENIKAPPSNLVKQDTSPKKNGSKHSKKKISPPQKGKQATLTNFFKKV